MFKQLYLYLLPSNCKRPRALTADLGLRGLRAAHGAVPVLRLELHHVLAGFRTLLHSIDGLRPGTTTAEAVRPDSPKVPARKWSRSRLGPRGGAEEFARKHAGKG